MDGVWRAAVTAGARLEPDMVRQLSTFSLYVL
jgi:hypothetical protein